MKKTLSIILSTVLILCSVFTVLPISAADEPVIVVAGSDFQNKTSDDEGKVQLDLFVEQIKRDGITDIDGFLFAGDYDYRSYNSVYETRKGVKCVKEAIGVLNPEHGVYVQGNHDGRVEASDLSPSGANDNPNGFYGVFAIHEDDFPWNTDSDETKVKKVAQNLINYLNAKLEADYKKPIFIVSHLPIHYNYRTKDNGDGIYAKYIFDALNEAGQKGLNIIFMYGHNHSNGWDNFLGGSTVFLAKGDKLNVAKAGSRTEFTEETLNFTYMNAGYVSYYTEPGNADDTLTMSVFEITSDSVKITRYSQFGRYQYLKSKGSTTPLNETTFSANEKTYSSPQTVSLSAVSDNTANTDVIESPKPIIDSNTVVIIAVIVALVIAGVVVILVIKNKDKNKKDNNT